MPEPLRGTFKAFTVANVERHAAPLRRSRGRASRTSTCCPSFDFATVDEDQSRVAGTGRRPRERSRPTRRSSRPRSVAVANTDGYNWGYDPYHYDVPEGSYATDPDGPARILEFREMVQALARSGLRVVMDVVYNHTNASGQNATSVLDRIVPGYYHRLNADGAVETSTCCQNTATEHAMMEKLMVDSVVLWATALQGGRLPLRPHGPPHEAEHARRAAGARRADPGARRRRRPSRSTSTARAGTSARWRTTRAA